jgi:hypothetical protein
MGFPLNLQFSPDSNPWMIGRTRGLAGTAAWWPRENPPVQMAHGNEAVALLYLARYKRSLFVKVFPPPLARIRGGRR